MNKRILLFIGSVVLVLFVFISFPALLIIEIHHAEKQASSYIKGEFPVTVNPKHRKIVEDDRVNALFEARVSPFAAAVGGVSHTLHKIAESVALSIASTAWYQGVASVGGRYVVITPGMRKEQVASSFAQALSWSDSEKKAFTTTSIYAVLPLNEGSYMPGVYEVEHDTTPLMAQALVNERFSDEILSHYGTTTASVVPLSQALTIASLIEREAAGNDDMRVISGIIWNRLFIGMPLQIDATLQYAKADAAKNGVWWPKVGPADLRRASAYNTYQHAGLPPTPIANPSIASVLAALNPVNTECLFYFHDNNHEFHCSATYDEHVALLKKYFGRGK